MKAGHIWAVKSMIFNGITLLYLVKEIDME